MTRLKWTKNAAVVTSETIANNEIVINTYYLGINTEKVYNFVENKWQIESNFRIK